MATHSERVGWPLWAHVLVVLAVLLVGAGSVGTFVRKGLQGSAVAGFAVATAVGLVWWRMRYLALEFGTQGIAFGFAGLRRRVPRERIASAGVESYSAARYMGWGYRIGWKPRDRAYSLLGHFRGVRVVFDDERGRRWSVFLSSGNPEAAVRALGR